MAYTNWFEKHALKHEKIITKLLKNNFSKDEIIKYFEFDNMVKNEIDFCPLYAKNKKCHDIDYLNCYLCACPNFRFDDNGIKKLKLNTQYSYCNIDSKDGEQGIYGTKIHQNCSACQVPHTKEYVEQNFDYNWKTIMQKCNINKG